MSWPHRNANFPGTCKVCKKKFLKDDVIHCINAGSSTKESYWCSDTACKGAETKVLEPRDPPHMEDGPEPAPSSITEPAHGQPAPPTEKDLEYSDAMVELDIATIRKSRASWIIALHDAQLVHPQNNTDSIRSKYILASVFYKGLMGVT